MYICTEEIHVNREPFSNQVIIKLQCDDEGLKKLNQQFQVGKMIAEQIEIGMMLLHGTQDGLRDSLRESFSKTSLEVKQILVSGPCTIVFWGDGTKTMVRCKECTPFNPYNAFTAALAKKIYKTNSQVNKILDRKLKVEYKKKVKKGVEADAKNSV